MTISHRAGSYILMALAAGLIFIAGGCGRKLTQQDLNRAQTAAEYEHKRNPLAVMPAWYRSSLAVQVKKIDGGIGDDDFSISVSSTYMNHTLLAFTGVVIVLALIIALSPGANSGWETFVGSLIFAAIGLVGIAFLLWLGVKIFWPSGHYLPWHFAITLSGATLVVLAVGIGFIGLLAVVFGSRSHSVATNANAAPSLQSLQLASQQGSVPLPQKLELSAEEVAAAIRPRRRDLVARVKTEVASSLAQMSPAQSLTFILMRYGEEVKQVPPGPSAEYVKVLIAFCRGAAHEGHEIDSAVTPFTLDAINRAVQEFYTSEEVSSAIASSISQQIQASGLVAHQIAAIGKENVDWLRREATTTLHQETAHSIAGQAIDATAASISHVMHTASGQAIAGLLAKVIATTGGKVLLMQALQAATAKVMASAAAKTMIMGFIKKVGVGILIKSAVGKLLIAGMAAVGLANIPIFYVLLPIIGLFLAYEYSHFPGKLAAKIPDEVEGVIIREFEPLNKSIAETIIENVMNSAIETITKVRTGPT